MVPSVAALPDPSALDRPWVDRYPPGVPPTYRVPDVALPRFLDDAARDFPDHPALVAGDLEVSHATFLQRVERLAGVLTGTGLAAGDRVLVALPSGVALPTVVAALWRIGAVVVPRAPSAQLATVPSVARHAEVAGVVATRAVLGALVDHDVLPAVAIRVTGDEWPPPRRLPQLRSRVRGRLGAGVGGRMRAGLPARGLRGPRGQVRSLATLLADTGPAVVPPAPAADAPALLAYHHHGTELRAAVLTHRNLVAAAFQVRLWVPDVQAGRERVLVVDALSGPTGLRWSLAASLSAATLVVAEDDLDPSAVVRLVERTRPTVLVADPRRLPALLAAGDAERDLSSLRVVWCGSGPLDPRVAADVERRTRGARVRQALALPGSGALTHAQPVYGRIVTGALGYPLSDTTAAVVDPADPTSLRPVGEIGRLVVHGPQVPARYWRREDLTAARTGGGWYRTDELVRIDEHGCFHHVGRLGEVVERDGAPVAPRHVESVLERHPAVRRAGVVGDAVTGELVAAVVTRRRGRPDPERLLAHCREQLVAPAVPDRIELVDELPETPAGDLDRAELRGVLAGRRPT